MSHLRQVNGIVADPPNLRFAWLEITEKCNLSCVHCYADSGPQGTHGRMELADWLRVITELAELGCQMVQFIGGEPTLHPNFTELIRFALGLNLRVEVYSNLARTISTELWEVFALPGVVLATSYYSAQPDRHEAVTAGRGSHARTRENIVDAVASKITLRVGVIGVTDDQQVTEAIHDLVALGVPHDRIALDTVRDVGRGSGRGGTDVDQLCGRCIRGVIAISSGGKVWPCVFSRWLPVGDVLTNTLREVIGGSIMDRTLTILTEAFAARIPVAGRKCEPADVCPPLWKCVPAPDEDDGES